MYIKVTEKDLQAQVSSSKKVKFYFNCTVSLVCNLNHIFHLYHYEERNEQSKILF